MNEMKSTMPHYGLGLLGVSSKYRPYTIDQKWDLLTKILHSNPAFIDTATVYGEQSGRINPILGDIRRTISSIPEVPIINKIGANLVDGENLGRRAIDEYEQGLHDLGCKSIWMTLVHRAQIQWIERDVRLFKHVQMRQSSDLFGICTNSEKILRYYLNHLNIDVVQVAVNPLDYFSALPVLRLAKQHNIVVQARSCLSSGLLGGNYEPGKSIQFTDDIRRRYHESATNRAIYSKRMESVASVIEFHRQLQQHGKTKLNLARFTYALIQASPFVDSVILGGSTWAQIQQNLSEFGKLDPECTRGIYDNCLKEWQAPYL